MKQNFTLDHVVKLCKLLHEEGIDFSEFFEKETEISTKTLCPVCGNTIKIKRFGTSGDIECTTVNCIRKGIRGI